MGLFEIEIDIKTGPQSAHWRESATVIADSAFLANNLAIEKIAARFNLDPFDLSIFRTTAS